MKKNLLSIAAVILFMFLAMATVKYHGPFDLDKMVEDKSDNRNYLLKNDSTKVYGEKIKLNNAIWSKHSIRIDKNEFKVKDIKGYRENGIYYASFSKQYIQRVVHGNLNVYFMLATVAGAVETTTTHDELNNAHSISHNTHHTTTLYFVQKGEDGIFESMTNDNIKDFVQDCPLAYKMVNKSHSKLREALKKDHDLISKVFEIYNNNCQKVEP